MSALSRLWSLRSERPTFVAVAIGVLVVLLAYPFVDWWLRAAEIAPQFRFWDFGAYNAAVDRWLAGEVIYEQNDNGGFHGTYLYPPVFLLLFRPFTSALPFREAAMAWSVFSVGLLWVGLQLAIGACGLKLRVWERGLLLWAILGFQPLLLGVKMGQTAAFLAGMLALALVALIRGQRDQRGSAPARLASGAVTAFVGTFKLSYAPSGAHLLANRDRFLGAVGAGIALVAASLVVFGAETNLTYVEVLGWGLGKSSDPRSPALWLAPYYRPLAWLPGALVLKVGASLAVAAGAVLAAPAADRETFALGVAAVPLLSPLTYAYYFVPLLPAVVVLLAVELERDGRPVVPLVGLLLVHLHSYGLKFFVNYLPSVFPAIRALEPVYWLLQPGLWGNLLLVGLAAARVAEFVTVPAWFREATGYPW